MNSETKRSCFYKNYIFRDLIVWFLFIFILPIILFVVYYISKEARLFSYEKIQEDSNILDQEPMKRVLLNKYENSLCNDGSVASYYIRESKTKSNIWIILLEGGYFCYNKETCKQRSLNSFNLTSSYDNKLFKYGKGILSSNQQENKHFYDVNTVSIPYCSSDLWLGNKKRCPNCTDEFNFMGHEILNSVLDDLLDNYSIKESKQVLLTGESAGGIGVLMNLQSIKNKLQKFAPNINLKAIIDSSWLIDLPYSFLCETTTNCFVYEIFLNSIKYWNAQIPSECSSKLKNIWDCFLPSNMIQFIQVPVFVIQSLFDETQLIEQSNQHKTVINLIDVIGKMRKKIKKSVQNLDSYFIPACINHMILTRDDWSLFKINGLYLQDAVNCWAMEHIELKNCELKLIEKCLYPNCNKQCPNIKHPDSNKTIDLLEYLNYFGLVNYKHLSLKLKLAENLIKKMNYFKLMKLLFNS